VVRGWMGAALGMIERLTRREDHSVSLAGADGSFVSGML
jgi:hypothetical protein